MTACVEAELLMLLAWPKADPAEPAADDVLAVAVMLTAADVADVCPSG